MSEQNCAPVGIISAFVAALFTTFCRISACLVFIRWLVIMKKHSVTFVISERLLFNLHWSWFQCAFLVDESSFHVSAFVFCCADVNLLIARSIWNNLRPAEYFLQLSPDRHFCCGALKLQQKHLKRFSANFALSRAKTTIHIGWNAGCEQRE